MNKFIVTGDGRLRFGDVALHKHLLREGETCIGGGVYEFDYIDNSLKLSGRSYDFGRVKWAWVETLILPECLNGMNVLYEGLSVAQFANVCYE